MPLDDTAPQLDALLLGTVLEMELSPRDNQVASKRYNLIPEHLQRPTSPIRRYMETALIYPQGSRAIGATIVHGVDDDRFDLDAILEFRTPVGWTPRQVLDELHAAFEGFPDVKKIERCTRCIQLQFAFMHLDVTPMDPDRDPRDERVGEIYHSPDQGRDERFRVNPYGFGQDFRARITMPSQSFQDHVRDVRSKLQMKDRLVPGTIMADADIDALPDPHHREIDDPAKIDRYTVDVLREMKRANEERIERLLENPNATPTHILRIAAAIGDNETAVPLRDCIEAMRPEFTPADRRPIDIKIRDIAQKDSDSDYYPVVIDALRKKIEREIDGRFADGDLVHLAVFGFAPMPVLMELGRLLSDLSAVSVYGRHREPTPGWAWPNDREPLEFTCVPGAPGPKKVALKLSVTAGIADDRVIQALPDEPVSLWEIRSSRLGASELRNKDDLSRFRELVGKTFDSIKDQHGMDVDLFVFPAAPAACAIEFGRTWQQKVHPPFLIYDQIPERGFLLRHAIGRPMSNYQDAFARSFLNSRGKIPSDIDLQE